MIDVRLPYGGWTPRDYQMPLWRYLRGGGDRAMAVWHRRSGKDEICLHNTMLGLWDRPGNYAHCLPEFLQGRKAIWSAINPHTGKRRIDEAFPQELRAATNDNEMFLRFKNDSTWQVIGSDRYDTSLVGSSYVGLVFSEFALSHPAAWGYARPMLEENNGWGIFITTPRGRNHAHDLYKYALKTPRWFCERLTVDDTDAMSEETLAETLAELRQLYGEDQGNASFRQELYCDWTAAVLGTYYALECVAVREEGRIAEVEALPDRPVHRAWDLGIGDDTSVWHFQAVGGQLFVLHHIANSGVGLEWWRDKLEAIEKAHGWNVGLAPRPDAFGGNDYVPHDAKVREWTSGRTRVETMRSLGFNPMLVPAHTIDDGINAVRRTLPLCVFHPRTETTGFAALEAYQREWDPEKKTFKDRAIHNWACHPADSFRYLALSWRPAPARVIKLPEVKGFVIPPPRENRRGMRL